MKEMELVVKELGRIQLKRRKLSTSHTGDRSFVDQRPVVWKTPNPCGRNSVIHANNNVTCGTGLDVEASHHDIAAASFQQQVGTVGLK